MSDNRNLILAFALSALVLLGWNYFVARPQMQAERARQAYVHKENAQAAAHPAPTPPGHPFVIRAGDEPMRADLFGIEHLEAHARRLGESCRATRPPDKRGARRYAASANLPVTLRPVSQRSPQASVTGSPAAMTEWSQ